MPRRALSLTPQPRGKSGKGAKGKRRPKVSARVVRAIAIAVVVTSVLLETFANIVQLVESKLVDEVITETRTLPTKAERTLKSLWP